MQLTTKMKMKMKMEFQAQAMLLTRAISIEPRAGITIVKGKGQRTRRVGVEPAE